MAFAQRVRTILPSHHIVVDIDDGYCDTEVACHVVTMLENIGASGVILEDQQRPRKCGHYAGKQLQEAGVFLTMYSTPCLFAAQEAMETAMKDLRDSDGLLPLSEVGSVDLGGCTSLLQKNLIRRDEDE